MQPNVQIQLRENHDYRNDTPPLAKLQSVVGRPNLVMGFVTVPGGGGKRIRVEFAGGTSRKREPETWSGGFVWQRVEK